MSDTKIGGTWYRWQGPDLVVQLQVLPRSSRDGFGDTHDNRLKVKLTAAPVDGKANQVLVAFLAKAFGLPKTRVHIDKGANSRQKTIRLEQPSRLPDGLDITPPAPE